MGFCVVMVHVLMHTKSDTKIVHYIFGWPRPQQCPVDEVPYKGTIRIAVEKDKVHHQGRYTRSSWHPLLTIRILDSATFSEEGCQGNDKLFF